MQGKGSLYYAGAWCGYGFHEDGLKAGMAAATALGAQIPWKARATCPKIGLLDRFFLGTFDRFAHMAITQGSLRLILPNGEERCYGSGQPATPSPGEGTQTWKLPRRPCSLIMACPLLNPTVLILPDGEEHCNGCVDASVPAPGTTALYSH